MGSCNSKRNTNDKPLDLISSNCAHPLHFSVNPGTPKYRRCPAQSWFRLPPSAPIVAIHLHPYIYIYVNNMKNDMYIICI